MTEHRPRRHRRLVSSVAASAIILLSTFGVSAAHPAVDPDQNAINALASTLTPTAERVDRILAEMQFTPIANEIPGFQQWPTLRKLETAYWAAIEAGGEDQGARFLKVISRIVAQEHANSIRFEKSLSAYFPEPQTEPIRQEERIGIQFRRPVSTAAPTDPTVRRTLLTLERYVDFYPGGMQSVLGRCCGHSQDAVYDILRSAPTRKDALASALHLGRIPPELQERLLRMVALTAEGVNSVKYEPELQPLLRQIDQRAGGMSGLGQHDGETHAHATLSPTDQKRQAELVESAARKTGLSTDQQHAVVASLRETTTDTDSRSAPERKTILNSVDTKPPPDDGLAMPAGPGGGGGGGGGGGNPVDRAQEARPHERRPPSENGARRNRMQYRRALADAGGRGGMHGGSGGMTTTGRGGGIGGGRSSFRAIRMARGGFGGVVFGAEVQGGTVPGIVELSWVSEEPGHSGARGHFDVVFQDGEIAATRIFDLDQSYAAWEIIHGRKGTFRSLDIANGEGVGLAGVVNDEPNRFLVHPALYGLHLGNDAVFADAVGFKMSPEMLAQKLSAAGAPQELVDKAVRWRNQEKGFYKIIDVETEIVRHDGLVRARRTAAGGFSDHLRSAALLSFQAFGWGGPLAEDATPFYDIVPALTTTFPQYHRLNDFAELFAIMRFAKRGGARIPSPTPPQRVTPLLYVGATSAGELVQTESLTEVTLQQAVAHRQSSAATITSLRAAGAPDGAIRLIEERNRIAGDILLIRLSIEQLRAGEMAATPQQDTITKETIRQLEEDLVGHLRKKWMARGEIEDAVSVASDTDRKVLEQLQKKVEAAQKLLSETEDALMDAEYPSYEERIAALPEAKRATAQRLYEAYDRALDDFDADSDAAEAALERELPPIDKSKVSAAEAAVSLRRRELEQRTTDLSKAIEARLPWFRSWAAAMAD